MRANPIFFAVLKLVCLIIAKGSAITVLTVRTFDEGNMLGGSLLSTSPTTSSTHHVISICSVVEALIFAHEPDDYERAVVIDWI